MAGYYDIAGNTQQGNFVGSFLGARQAKQQADRQNMLFEQQQQDRAAQQQAEQQQAQTKAQQAAAEWGVNAVGVLAPLKDRPEDFNRAADVFAAEAAQRGIPLRREEITPENVAALEAQLRIRGGMAPPAAPKPQIEKVGDSIVSIENGQANELFRAPEKAQQPQQYAPQFSTITDAEGKVWRFNERTGQAQELGVNAPRKPAPAMPLRKEFNTLPEVKNFREALPVLVSARKMPNDGAGDIGLVYAVGKVLDPNSVVREGELALALQSGGLLSQIVGTTNLNLTGGARLNPQVRERLLKMLNERVWAYRQAYEQQFQQYGQYAAEAGLKPEEVVGRHLASAYQEASSAGGPAAPKAAPKRPDGVTVERIP